MEREDNVEGQIDMKEQEEVLVALIEHRTKQVESDQQRLAHYTAELEKSTRLFEEAKLQLSRLRARQNRISSKRSSGSLNHITSNSSGSGSLHELEPGQDTLMLSKNSHGDVKCDQQSSSSTFLQISEGSSRNKTRSRPQLVIPAANPVLSGPLEARHFGANASNGSNSRPSELVPTHTNSSMKLMGKKTCETSFELEDVETQTKRTKRNFEQKEHKDLVGLIGRSSSARTIHCQMGSLISSQHKRRLRSLVLCPTNDQLFVTSALDGVVNLWQVQASGSSPNFLSSTDCASAKQRRWPEDITWHPNGNSLFAVYTAEAGDSQVAVLDLNKAKERSHLNFLEDKPHVKGIINNIMFMPWEDSPFVTGGSDHAVVLWTEKDRENNWKPKALHRNLHSSAVMGVAGMQHKQIVISVGADKRITGFDVPAGRVVYRHQIENKCMSVLPNPCDFNLLMVQTGTPKKQLRLFDYRLRETEIHAFGWEQESSESQSALINQAWSPDGLYITSGSADPVIHIFDIRYNAHKPSQSIRTHQKRVFKAAWHHSLPLLISISSDLNIGLHKIT